MFKTKRGGKLKSYTCWIFLGQNAVSWAAALEGSFLEATT